MQAFVSVAPHFHQGVFSPLSLTDLLAEPCLFSCSPEAAKMQGGKLVLEAISQLEEIYERPIRIAKENGLSAIVDVRVQRLMPGMYPSIPGWHCDAVPRNTYHGQPDFALINPHAFHVALLLSNEPKGVSNTEYVQTSIKPKIWDNQHVYRDLHTQVERIAPDTVFAKDGQFTWFSPKTIHRAAPCHRRGVRLFMRYSMYHKPPLANKVGGEQQVYVISEENGW